MTTASALIDTIEEGLNDTNNDTWSRARLLTLLSRVMQHYCGEFGRMMGTGWFQESLEIVVAANTESYDLSTLTDAATKRFKNVNAIFYKHPNGDELPVKRVADADYRKLKTRTPVSVDDLPAYQLRSAVDAGTLNIMPLCVGARTFRLEYRWLPALLTSEATTLPLPDEYLDLFDAEVRARALRDENQINQRLEAFIAERWAAIKEDIGSATSESEPRRRRSEVGSRLFSGGGYR